MKASKSSRTRESIYFIALIVIPLAILNIPQLHNNLLMTLPGIILFLLIPSYGITLLWYSFSEISNSRRVLLSFAIGIILTVLWVLISEYVSTLGSNLSYTILSILIIIFVLIVHLSGKNESDKSKNISKPSKSSSEKKYNEDLRIQTAKLAAIEKKRSDNKIPISNNEDIHHNSKPEILRPKKPVYDLFIIIVISLLSSVIVYLDLFNQNPVKIFLLFISVFILSGYATLSVLIPNFAYKNILKRLFLSIVVSTILLLVLGIISIFTQFYEYPLLILAISLFTFLMSIIAYIKQFKNQSAIKEPLKADIPQKSAPDDLKIYTPSDARAGNLNVEPAWIKIQKQKEEEFSNLEKTGEENISSDLDPFEYPEEQIVKDMETLKYSDNAVFNDPELIQYPEIPDMPLIKESDYVKQTNKHNTIKLASVIIFSLLGLSFTLVPSFNDTLWRLVFTIPLVFFISGYALKELLFFNRLKGTAKTLIISIVLSTLLVSMLFIVLSRLPQSPSSSTYIIIVACISIVGIMWASIRNRKHTESVHEVLERIEIDRVIKSVPALENRNITEDILNQNFDNILEDKIVEDDLKLSFLTEDHFQKETVTSYNTETDENLKNQKSSNPNPGPDKRRSSLSKFSFLGNDLFLIILTMIIYGLIIVTPSLKGSVLETIVGLLFIIFIPGYALISALFPKNSDLEPLERIALSFGMSLAISALVGVFLNYTPYGLNKIIPLVAVLDLFTLLCVITVFLRRRTLKREEKFQANIFQSFSIIKNFFQIESRSNKILSIILIITLIAAISTTAYLILIPKEGEKFTEFYILGPDGKASDYPTNLTLGETGVVKIGIVNHEATNVTYKLLIKLNGTTVREQEITLLNNQTWQQDYNFTPTQTGADKKMEFLLYKLPDQNNVYRSLHLWVTVT